MLDDFAALRLLIEWGADEAIAAEPIDRLGTMTPLAALPVAPTPAVAAVLSPALSRTTPVGTPGERALAAAGGSSSLEALRAAVAGFDGCALRDTAGNLVFAEGDPDARVMLIGEPPGREEDRSGHPFAGAEGQLLEQMLASIGLAREALLLTHLLPWRPPGGRPPHPAELALCLPFLHRLVALSLPARLLLLGASVSRALLGRGVVRRRGAKDWVDMAVPGLAQPVRTLELPSLADLLRTPNLKREAWTGLRLLRRALDEMLP